MDFEYFIGSKWNNFDWFIELWSLVDIKWGKRVPKWKTYSQNFIGYKYLRVDDLDENWLFVFDNLKNIDEEVYNSIKNYFIEKENLCVSIAGTIWKIALIEEDFDKKLILTENCAKLIIKDKKFVLPKYLKFVLKSSISQNQFESNYWQATIAKLSLERLKQTKIPIPPLDIQKQIVEKMEQVFAKKQTLEAESKEILKNIDEYVLWELGIKLPEKEQEKMCFSVDLEEVKNSRFDVFYNKPEFKFLENALKNSRFEIKKLWDFINDIRYWASVKNNYVETWIPLLRIKDIKPNIIDVKDIIYLDNNMRKELWNCFVYDWDFLISRSWTVWIVALVKKDLEWFAFWSFMIKFNLKEEFKINKMYISYWLNNMFNQIFIEKEKIWAIQWNITIDTIKSFYLPFPPIDIQNKIVDEVNNRIKEAKEKEQQAKEIYEKTKKEAVEMILK